MCMFRDLKASEVECRIGMQNSGGLSLLLYKDARVDMAILDEAVGQENWQCRFYEHKGILFCSLGIRIGGEWIWKDDAGSESNTEAEKGNASDARKRAAVCWGIGRELYTAPFIWIKNDNFSVNDKGKCRDSFFVKSIEIKDKVITALEIVNTATKKVVYTHGKVTPPATAPKTPVEPPKAPTPAVDPGIEKERQWAINYVVQTGVRAGMKLGDIFKMDKPVFFDLANNPPSEEIAKATTIIKEWVGVK